MPRKVKVSRAKKPKTLRSGFEKKIAKILTDREIPFGYESVRIPYTVPESKHYYTPDFELPNGVIIEAKGIFDRIARAKMALVLEQNPDRDIRILFMRNNKVNKNSKMTYGDWCTKRGIKWAVSLAGEIPEEWLT